MSNEASFGEAMPGTRIRDLGLHIVGTPLEAILAEFRSELVRIGIHRLQPHFYLSTEWGVPFGTITIAIPFYLARPELTEFHASRAGHVEGATRADILRYLRHEMGHVVNYAYRLYDREDWVKCFGSITQPYEEEYRPQPFSLRFVRHLPGWYAQKHPDEDWAETFAVWMTPRTDWRFEYRDWPEALAKLELCEQLLATVREEDPLVTTMELDEDASDIEESLDHFYQKLHYDGRELMPAIDGPLRAIFNDVDEGGRHRQVRAAAELIRRIERPLAADIYRWTGHFPERTLRLLQHIARRAEVLTQSYFEDEELAATMALTTLVTALAMNFVYRGSYVPASDATTNDSRGVSR